MTTTNVTGGGNFYVYTDDIYGQWSQPIYVKQEGIDPSLYFEDGKAYFMSNGFDKNGRPAILQCEIDIDTGEIKTPVKALWNGSGGRYLESPHLYKIGGYYYLTAAEGGTEYGHMVTYARSENLWGDYEAYTGNPVLTNRDLGGYEIQGIGHSDLVDDVNGNWWIFHLGFRQISRWEPFHHLGREVFLMPVEFNQDGWFVVPGGVTTKTVETGLIDTIQRFDNHISEHDRCFLRSFNKDNYVFEKGCIRIKSSSDTLDCAGSPSFVGFRQKEFGIDLSVTVRRVDGQAGVSVYMDEKHHYDLAVTDSEVKLMLNIGDIKHCAACIKIEKESDMIHLKITSDSINYRFWADGIELGKAQTRYLSSEVACGFTGAVIGLYSQHGKFGGFNEFWDFTLSHS
jgi:alpha-N-arabinofuranosidase